MGLEWVNLTQMTIISTTAGRNPSEEMVNKSHHDQQKSLKCSTWMQSQKQQNDLCLFPRQTIQYLLFDHFQFALIHRPDIPNSYAILLFIASDLAFITSHIHNWVLFLLWLHPFILSGVISNPER